MAIIKENFSQFPICSGVAILITTNKIENAAFLNAYDQQTANAGIGLDEEDLPANVAACFAAAKQQRFAYADGIITYGIKPGVYKSMLEAKGVQAANKGERPKLIYSWVVESSDTMRNFLNIHIDGLIVNVDSVVKLRNVLAEKDFFPMYELAKNGYNPWSAPPIPQYYASILTSNAYLAGTDMPVRLTLTGTQGALTTALNGSYKNVFEAGETDHTSFEGAYIGDITSLTLSLLNTNTDSDWLPALVTVTNNLNNNTVFFNFGLEDWVVFQHPVTKLPH